MKNNFDFTDIIVRLAQSSSESELDANTVDITLVEQDHEADFTENLLAFQDTVPRYLKNKKAHRQKKKVKKDRKFIFYQVFFYEKNMIYIKIKKLSYI